MARREMISLRWIVTGRVRIFIKVRKIIMRLIVQCLFLKLSVDALFYEFEACCKNKKQNKNSDFTFYGSNNCQKLMFEMKISKI